ncbi:phage late control D family protein [Paenibacillaceae bacterium WGS1546]|uniref:phage late control D family protein n=1 Tax=Cohnella sp. WGS1546 TaxID=3366810 RepID=UPI00372D141C
MNLDTQTYTFGRLEEEYGNFFAPAFEIAIDGQPLHLMGIAVSSLSVETTTEARADNCRFKIENAYNLVSRQFDWVGSLIDVGKSVVVKMGYTDKLVTMFDGIVTGVALDYPSGSQPTVGVTCMDRSMLMMRSVQSNVWHDMKVSDVVKQIGAKYGFQLRVKDTGDQVPTIEQFKKSDFHFLREQAENEFCEFFVLGQTLYFRDPDAVVSPVVTLMYGKNLISYSADVDISKQVSQIVVRGYDRKTHKPVEAKSGPIDLIGTNGRAGADIMNTLSRHLIEYVYLNSTTQLKAKKIADAKFKERSMDLVTGQGESIGIPELRAGRFVKLEGLGPKFDQPMLIGGATHTIDGGGYSTSFTVKGNAI